MKRTLVTLVLAGILGFAQAQNNSMDLNQVKSAMAISCVQGDGRKVQTVVLDYGTPIRNRSLSANSYGVEGREVTRVYANRVPENAGKGVDGRYVVIEMKTTVNLNAQPKQPSAADMAKKKERDRMQGGPGLRAGWSTGGDNDYPGRAVVEQLAVIKTAKGTAIKPCGKPFSTTRETCLVADDFKQETFVSPYTGQALPYNIYLPKNYNSAKKYPLVLFIHDAGTASGPIKQTLYQGTGATSWAEPEAQQRHECIVVAPEYPVVTVDDSMNYSHHLDATVALLKDLQQRYAIDAKRIYATGQSMGCMSSIVLLLKEPDLFAGALLVAGKWNPSLMKPLARQNLWIISCEGDTSSTTLQGQAVALWRQMGNKVTEATWDMTLPEAQLSQEADKMRAEGNHLLFTHLTGGSHRATWFVAYGIRSVQDWLFEQHR